MEFTRSKYRRAIRLAENEVYSRADILQWAKDQLRRCYPVTPDPYRPSPILYWTLSEKVNEARTGYFKALDLLGAIKDRAKREGKLK